MAGHVQRLLETLRGFAAVEIPDWATRPFRFLGIAALILLSVLSAWLLVGLLGGRGNVLGDIMGLGVLLFVFALGGVALAKWYQKRRFRKLRFPPDA